VLLLLSLGLGFLVVVVLVVVIFSSEKKTIFSPDLEPEWIEPQEMGAASDELEEVTFTTDDGVMLYGWFYRTFLQKLIAKIQDEQDKRKNGESASKKAEDSQPKEPKPLLVSPTVLYLHGNSGNISHRFPLLREFANGTQFNFFVADYRGYGKSEGEPSEEGLKKDAEAMLNALLKRDDIDKSRIIVYGQGIGGSLAIHLATQEKTKKLFQAMVIENTFTNIRDMASLLMPGWLSPLAGMTKCKFDSLALLKENKLEVPTLFIATSKDEVVPHNQMKQLFRVAKRHTVPECKENVKMLKFEGTEHHNVPSINPDVFFKTFLEWSCKVLLHETYSDEEMKELEKGFMDLADAKGDVEKEVPELIDSVEEDEDEEGNGDKKDGGDGDDDDDDEADVIPAAEKTGLHKRVKGNKDGDQMDLQD